MSNRLACGFRWCTFGWSTSWPC